MLQRIILPLLKYFYPIVKKWMPFQVYVYLAVGTANTALNIGLFVLLYKALAHAPFAVEWATAVSFMVTVLTGFWLSKHVAFTGASNKKAAVQKQFGKYMLVSLQGQFSDYLITKGLIVLLLLNPVLAYFISTLVMLVVNYFLQKYFTFRNKQILHR